MLGRGGNWERADGGAKEFRTSLLYFLDKNLDEILGMPQMLKAWPSFMTAGQSYTFKHTLTSKSGH